MTARVIPFAPPATPVPPPSRERMLEEIAIARQINPDMPAARAAYIAGFMAGFMKGACSGAQTR